jgi:CheY-like chemotaxis protein
MNQSEFAEILLIEDTKSDAELMSRALLKKNPFLKILHIQDGKETLDYFERSGRFSGLNAHSYPKVVFLDLKIPKISGFEILQKIKEKNPSKTIPVVIISSSEEANDIQTCYLHGANSYVVKPMTYLDFETTICNLGTYWLDHNHHLS